MPPAGPARARRPKRARRHRGRARGRRGDGGARRGSEGGADGHRAPARPGPCARHLDPGHRARARDRLGQGRRRQVLGHREPGRRPRLARPRRRGHRRRCRRILAAPPARNQRPGRGSGRQDGPARQAGGHRRAAGPVHGLPRRGGPGAPLARARAQQGRAAVHRGRGLVRHRLPACGPAARDERRAHGPRAHPAPDGCRARHDAAPGGAARGGPGGRPRQAIEPPGRGRHREYELVRLRPRLALRAVRRRGRRRLADQLGVELLAQVPFEPALGAGGDEGSPVALTDLPVAEVFAGLAARIVADVAPPPGAAGCTARMLDALERAVEG